ncbi:MULTISPECIES: exonuclease domain-containing protein [Aestuariibaculum]|uniref:GIY-YIG nuclease family protein n=1 Tax=Aestuariibaculum lutulentum TaxID=2920935 RepID=A0ABS9RJ05_9FLAO|nr:MULTISPECIES: exonuclease domain-containing protein [Aestuariibaculum]MCH4552928.1 GIY-YIG nuclease family protein [Aestuariibaculum lutulentum]MCR8669178.1 exonuclease domain-containing protein [Aestuariibaculum sp. M13]
MYAILDIETTGGKYNEEGITEIAIYKYDGHQIVDQFISLVNPEREIQPFVVNLTGINSNMLRNAPKFFEVAKRIVEITEDCILVAHNAQFDYRILCTEFRRLGFEYIRPSLCSVELSKQLIPGQPSYSLGKLVRSLGIPVSDRHRASGDALATLKLFKLLLDKDTSKSIIQQSIKLNPKHQLEPRHLDILADLPSETGVYYIHNAEGNIIYIGKSNNIKKRVNQHFTNTNRKSKQIQNLVDSVSYETTGSELVALLKESEAIKNIKPKFNRALRRTRFTHALYSFTDDKGYINLKIDIADGRKKPITTFSNRDSGKSFINHAVEEYKLCQKLTGIYQTKTSCFNYDIKQCEGACIGKESPENYNDRVSKLIAKNSYTNQNMVIIDRGRDIDERSAILIENGVFKGIGFYNLNYQINNIEILQSIITPMQNNRDTQHIIQSYLRKNKKLKTILFD